MSVAFAAKKEWEETKYGRKMQLDANTVRIQIDPGKNTSLSAKKEDLDQYGFRGHPGTIKEMITYIGAVDGSESISLHYIGRDKNSDKIKDYSYLPGTTFFSVEGESGY